MLGNTVLKKVAVAWLVINATSQGAFAEPAECPAIYAAMRNQADTLLVLMSAKLVFLKDVIRVINPGNDGSKAFERTKSAFKETEDMYDPKKVLAGIESLNTLCPDAAKTYKSQ
jgi:hypothetical protein